MRRASQVCRASPITESLIMCLFLAGMSLYLLLVAQSWHFHPGKAGWRVYIENCPVSATEISLTITDLRKRARLAARIKSMVNFTENIGDAHTPSKVGCHGKPSWPGSYKQALNKPCVIFKVLHSERTLKQCQCFFPCFRLCNLFLLTDILIILLIVIVIINGSQICRIFHFF